MINFDSIYEEEDAIHIVMDYLPGGTLKDFMRNNGVLTDHQSFIVLQTLLKMLQHLNSLGIIHRDLKPENIMLREPKISSENLVLIDFGFSVFMSETPFDFKRCGTPGFMGAEILSLKNDEPMYGPKCDIFSVGIIWYYCLFGSLPFKARSSKELISKNKKGDLSFGNSKKFKTIESSIKKLLERNPNDRIDVETALNTDYLFNILCDDENTDEIDGELPSKNIERLNRQLFEIPLNLFNFKIFTQYFPTNMQSPFFKIRKYTRNLSKCHYVRRIRK